MAPRWLRVLSARTPRLSSARSRPPSSSAYYAKSSKNVSRSRPLSSSGHQFRSSLSSLSESVLARENSVDLGLGAGENEMFEEPADPSSLNPLPYPDDVKVPASNISNRHFSGESGVLESLSCLDDFLLAMDRAECDEVAQQTSLDVFTRLLETCYDLIPILSRSEVSSLFHSVLCPRFLDRTTERSYTTEVGFSPSRSSSFSLSCCYSLDFRIASSHIIQGFLSPSFLPVDFGSFSVP